MQPLVISRTAIVNSLGAGLAATANALRDRRSGLAPCAFENVALNTYVGQVAGLENERIRPDLAEYDCRNNRLAQVGLQQDGFAESIEAAIQKYGADRIGVFMGTSTSGILQTELAYRRRDSESGALPADFHYAQTQNTFSLADFVQRYFGLKGPSVVVSSACSSTAKVFGNAARMIAAGVCDAAIVGGVDTLCLTTLYGFNSLGLVSQSPCRPYDVNRDGISLGEGAGFALLEKQSTQSAGEMLLLGIGESSDAYHMSTPHPEGMGAKLAIQSALNAAGLRPEDIDYVNLHGTSTKSNDASEDKAVYGVFGAKTPCSSTKGWTGHLLGAAGITEAIISMLAIENSLIPGSLNTLDLDPELKSNYQINNLAIPVNRVVSNSFGFGGSNCSLVLGRAI
ncbi:beta-ketoacyl-[acyl-carrier-protein] synthase family protein [Sulfurirhabdus autotrophica]|uniref:3-oxoacyl-[acyl-carrier-protein] synthase-1 n=1 Tax=Sulfurirhabdus autotrophica TaxID=1706046 RepID=A0A4R3Y6L0_9PROT|nr:beta-ketoacyl-[acyl-carrier-protein] synthase family protein [Sulfurirhabdus autotrophica]TCV87466.1 3-oxoacyl-[acyl-carrier-protein] synthase-1 [Sulfurirhabdus autotrophica]